jgi:hypothetical protein
VSAVAVVLGQRDHGGSVIAPALVIGGKNLPVIFGEF